MRRNYFGFLSGGSRLLLEGASCNRLLALLEKDGVTVYNVKRDGTNRLTLSVGKHDKKALEETAEKLGFTVTETQRLGLAALAKRMVLRLGFAVVLAVLITAYAFASGYVWRVEIEGNDRVDRYAIAAALADSGAKRGSEKKTLDFAALERTLRELDGISEATVSLRGTTLKVSVLESLKYEPVPSGGKRIVLSEYDAEVTRIVLRRGTALAHSGQRVFKGTPLLSGDLTGTDGTIIGSGYADGEVYGKAVFSDSVTVALDGIKTSFTGRTERSTVLSVFGLTWGKRRDDFEYAEIETTTETLSPLLPVKVTSILAREQTREPYSLDRDEAIEEAKALLRSRLDERFIGGEREEKYIVREVAVGVITVELYATKEILIGES